MEVDVLSFLFGKRRPADPPHPQNPLLWTSAETMPDGTRIETRWRISESVPYLTIISTPDGQEDWLAQYTPEELDFYRRQIKADNRLFAL